MVNVVRETVLVTHPVTRVTLQRDAILHYYHGTSVANIFNVKSIAHGIQQIETRKVHGEVGKSLALNTQEECEGPSKASCAREMPA